MHYRMVEGAPHAWDKSVNGNDPERDRIYEEACSQLRRVFYGSGDPLPGAPPCTKKAEAAQARKERQAKEQAQNDEAAQQVEQPQGEAAQPPRIEVTQAPQSEAAQPAA